MTVNILLHDKMLFHPTCVQYYIYALTTFVMKNSVINMVQHLHIIPYMAIKKNLKKNIISRL